MNQVQIRKARRKKALIDYVTWGFLFMAGWWLRGFCWHYFGTTNVSKIISESIKASGSIEGFITVVGAGVMVALNVKKLFQKRSGG